MKKGHLLIFVCVVLVIVIAFAFVINSERRVEKLQSELRNSYQYLNSANNKLTELSINHKQLENQNHKLLSYIEAKEAQDNRKPIGFKTDQVNGEQVNSNTS